MMLLVAAAAGLCACAPQARTGSTNILDWSGMDNARPGKSSGPWTAYLDSGVVTPPGDDVPAAVRVLSGRWQGWMKRDKSGSVAVEIARMDARSASGRYAYGGIDNVNGSLSPVRVFGLECTVMEQSYLECGIIRPGFVGLKVYIKARSDQVAMIRYTGNGGQTYTSGLMTRE